MKGPNHHRFILDSGKPVMCANGTCDVCDNESEYPDDAPMWACEACDAEVPKASLRDFSTHSGEVSVCSECRGNDE